MVEEMAEEAVNGNLRMDNGLMVNYLMMLILTQGLFHPLIIQMLHMIHGECDYPFVEVVFLKINAIGI